MKKLICFLLTLLLMASLSGAALAAEFEIDPYAVGEGMEKSWYQGYAPTAKGNTLTLCLPIRAESCVGEITASIALEDPYVFLLAAQPQPVTVFSRDGVYFVKLQLPLQRSRRNGDYPAVITLRGTDPAGKEIVETVPYVIRIRDGQPSHESMTPMISNMVGDLHVGSDGSLRLTVTNPTTTLSVTDGEITVTDTAGEILMSGINRVPVGEILPGKTAEVIVPMTVMGHAAIRQHTLQVEFSGQVLGMEAQWREIITVPVTQEIRLENGGVQLPAAIAGELSNMTLTLMNMGKGELRNVLVKLEAEGAMDAQSVLVGTMAAGETAQPRLTFTPKLNSVGAHAAVVTVSCEDAYGNAFSQTLDAVLTVEEPIPEAEMADAEESEAPNPKVIILSVVNLLLIVALILLGTILTKKIHTLEEERL